MLVPLASERFFFLCNPNPIKNKIIPILKKNDVVKSSVFGSYARGDNNPESDIDILIEFKGRKSLFDLVGLQHEIEDELGRKVDLLTYKSIHPLLKDYILRTHIITL